MFLKKIVITQSFLNHFMVLMSEFSDEAILGDENLNHKKFVHHYARLDFSTISNPDYKHSGLPLNFISRS